MKFNVSSSKLFAQLQAVSRVIAAKNSLQILEAVDLNDIHELERWIENCLRDGYAKAQEIASEKMKPLMGKLGNLGL